MAKPFWLFCGMDYEASGGMKDIAGTFASIDDAFQFMRDDDDGNRIHSKDWWHIINVETKEVFCMNVDALISLPGAFTLRQIGDYKNA